MEAPLVSILIPSFNAERWIKQTLESAIGQDYPRTEVIVVDDGSTDRTMEIARTFRSRSVQVISQTNAGAPAARNKALSLAQGDFIQWLDHDDLLALGKISNQIKEWEKVRNDRVLFSCPFATFYYRWHKAKSSAGRLYRDLTPLDYFLIKFSNDTFLHPSSWLVNRKLCDLAGPWWELRSPDDDGEYFCRVVAASEGIRFVPQSRCYWRVGHEGNFSQDWRRSRASLESLFQTTVRCVEHYMKLEDSERSRAACVAFLQHRLIYCYPNRPDIAKQMNELARALGGGLNPPPLTWKYRYIRAAFGWPTAKKCMMIFPDFKRSVERVWDRLLCRCFTFCG